MNKKFFKIGALLLCFTFLASCNSGKTEQKQEEEKAKTAQIVGNDRDEHGCIRSAGYQWSEVLKDCIRPFEKGVKLATAADTTSTSAAYLVFSKDSSRIEAFVPNEEIPPVLEKDTSCKKEVWKDKDDRGYSVNRPDGKWTVYQNGKWLFSM